MYSKVTLRCPSGQHSNILPILFPLQQLQWLDGCTNHKTNHDLQYFVPSSLTDKKKSIETF